MIKTAKKIKFDNDAWITSHFEEIVDKYGGKYPYILVSRGRVFPVKAGEDIAKIEARITRKYGKPIGMPVPQPKDFFSILPLKK
jgi:hypothetical protein